MRHLKKYIMALTILLASPALAAQDEYITAQELQDILRGDNLWCYEYTDSCGWIEDIDLTANKLTQWVKEYNSGDNIMLKFAALRLQGQMICDVKGTANENFNIQYYRDPTNSWQAVDKIAEIFEYLQPYEDQTLEDYNQYASCYSYIDRGFTFNGYRKIEQIVFEGGPKGRPRPKPTMLAP